MAGGVAGHDLCRVTAGRAPTLSATVHDRNYPRGERPGFAWSRVSFCFVPLTIGRMSDAARHRSGSAALKAVAATRCEQLLERFGAEPTVAPSMREVPLEQNRGIRLCRTTAERTDRRPDLPHRRRHPHPAGDHLRAATTGSRSSTPSTAAASSSAVRSRSSSSANGTSASTIAPRNRTPGASWSRCSTTNRSRWPADASPSRSTASPVPNCAQRCASAARSS